MRTLLGYAVIAVVVFFAIKVAFTLLGVALTLFWNLLWLAAVGFVIYLILKLINPAAAARLHDAIVGKRPSSD
ncbi:MAG: hypothetical protein OEY20_13995 [Gemmatimonadota bacterium]|nr:hypothetical protein [Gemmatimonadota bacterium]MDH5198350.1 hypothetical protein [Gemmatimonadota bacterium]